MVPLHNESPWAERVPNNKEHKVPNLHVFEYFQPFELNCLFTQQVPP